MRLRYVPLVATALLAAGTATGCDAFDPPDAEYGGICVDPATHERLPDERCGDYDGTGSVSGGGAFFLWMPMNGAHPVPSIGERADPRAGTRTVPAGTPIAKGVPTRGGASMSAIQRGGFGIKAGTTGGIGARAVSAGS